MQNTALFTCVRKLDGENAAYVEKLGEHPLTTQFNICAKHLEKDLALHWPIIDDPQWEGKAQLFVLGPVRDEIKNFADQNDYPDILVTIVAAKADEMSNSPECEEGNLTRFETGNGYVLILACEELPWHAPPTVFGDHGCITKLDGDEDVYRHSANFLDMFFSRNSDLTGHGAHDALRRTMQRLHQYDEHNPLLSQQLYNIFVVLGLLTGRENLDNRIKVPAGGPRNVPVAGARNDAIGPVGHNTAFHSVFTYLPVAKVAMAYALTRLMDPNLPTQERLYFRGLAQGLYASYEPPITQAAHIAAADIDHHHVVHPNAQKAHRDMSLRQQNTQRQQTLEPGMDGGGSE